MSWPKVWPPHIHRLTAGGAGGLQGLPSGPSFLPSRGQCSADSEEPGECVSGNTGDSRLIGERGGRGRSSVLLGGSVEHESKEERTGEGPLWVLAAELLGDSRWGRSCVRQNGTRRGPLGSVSTENLSLGLRGRGTTPSVPGRHGVFDVYCRDVSRVYNCRGTVLGGGVSLVSVNTQVGLSVHRDQWKRQPKPRKPSAFAGSVIAALLVTGTPAPGVWPRIESFERRVGEESASGSHQLQEDSAYYLGCLRNLAQVPGTIDQKSEFRNWV